MARNIIQHHEKTDFDGLFHKIAGGMVNIGFDEYEAFLAGGAPIHSFMGAGNGPHRIEQALDNATAAFDAKQLLKKTTALMALVLRSKNSENPIRMEELKALTEFLRLLPQRCDVIWGLGDDDALGDEVRVVMLVKTDVHVGVGH